MPAQTSFASDRLQALLWTACEAAGRANGPELNPDDQELLRAVARLQEPTTETLARYGRQFKAEEARHNLAQYAREFTGQQVCHYLREQGEGDLADVLQYGWVELPDKSPPPSVRKKSPKAKVWKGTPPDKGRRYQINEPGFRKRAREEKGRGRQPPSTPPTSEVDEDSPIDLKLTRNAALVEMGAPDGREFLEQLVSDPDNDIVNVTRKEARDRAREMLGRLRERLDDEAIHEFVREMGLDPDGCPAGLGDYLYSRSRGLSHEDALAAVGSAVEPGLTPGAYKLDLPEPEIGSREDAEEHVWRCLQSAERTDSVSDRRFSSFMKTVGAVTGRMPDVALRRAAANLKGFNFAGTMFEVSDACMKSIEQAIKTDPAASDRLLARAAVFVEANASKEDAQKIHELLADQSISQAERQEAARTIWERFIKPNSVVPEGEPAGGCYDAISEWLTLNGSGESITHEGPEEFEIQRGDYRTNIYAHEFIHAVDGPDWQVSSSPQWKAVWEKEIKRESGWFSSGEKQTLTEYASSAPHEGLAEFGRLLYGTSTSLEDVENSFPHASQFFKDNGLWPT